MGNSVRKPFILILDQTTIKSNDFLYGAGREMHRTHYNKTVVQGLC